MWRLCNDRLVNATIGDVEKSCRWWSTHQKARHQRPLRSACQMLLVFIGYRRKWWAKFADIPLGQALHGDLCGMDAPDAAGLEALDQGDDLAAPMPVDGLDEPAPSRVGIAAARREVERRRQLCIGQLEYVARVLSRRKYCRIFDGIVLMAEPLELRFNQEVTAMKTQGGTKELVQSLVRGGEFAAVFHQMLRLFLSPRFTETLRLRGVARGGPILALDQDVGDVMWRFTYSLIGELAVSNLKYSVPPQCFVGLTDPELAMRHHQLERLQTMFEPIESLERIVHTDGSAKAFWNSLEWPLETWARENFSLLAEARFEIVYGWLEQELVDYACVEWSTLRARIHSVWPASE